jgi:CheY-like chemotaxis protein
MVRARENQNTEKALIRALIMIDPFIILVADDDPEDQEILKEYLLGENPALSIYCVYNGREALSTLNSLPGHELPSLIILDYKSPS